MAPLDTGYVTQTLRLVDKDGPGTAPSSDDYETLGAYLRALREHRGQTLKDLADSTRIRRPYLAGIEDGDRSVLPSRPFAIGYVRSYARALGLDGDLAVARFKIDWPEDAEPLRNPVGVEHDDDDNDARKPLIWAGVAVVVVALGLWNIAQRALISDQPPASGLDPAVAAQPLALPSDVVKLQPTTPPPQESTMPAPYITPGLGDQTGGGAPADAAPQVAVYADPAVFTPRGAVYGSPAGPVVLQAKRPSSLVVRGADKTVYFARQLAAGEAFRATLGKGLTAEMTDPSAFVLYLGGALRGPLTSATTPLDSLAPAAAPAVATQPPPAPAR